MGPRLSTCNNTRVETNTTLYYIYTVGDAQLFRNRLLKFLFRLNHPAAYATSKDTAGQ